MPANSRWDLIRGLKGYAALLHKHCVVGVELLWPIQSAVEKKFFCLYSKVSCHLSSMTHNCVLSLNCIEQLKSAVFFIL